MEDNSKLLRAFADEISSIKKQLSEITLLLEVKNIPHLDQIPTYEELDAMAQRMIDVDLRLDKLFANEKKVRVFEVILYLSMVALGLVTMTYLIIEKLQRP